MRLLGKIILLVSVCFIVASEQHSGPHVDTNKLGLPIRQLQQIDIEGGDKLNAAPRDLSEKSSKISKDADMCAAVKNFIQKETEISEKLIPNTTNMCTNLAKTCCTAQDFNSLEKWWEGVDENNKVIKMSRRDVRQHKQEDLILYTSKMLDSYERMKAFSTNMVNPINKPDNFCIDVANSFKSYVPDYKIFNKVKYTSYAKKCWDFLNLLQTTILCSLCDSEAQEIFHLNKNSQNKIFLTQEGLNDFNQNCREVFLFNVKIFRPYLQLVEKLTRCTERGHLKASMLELNGEVDGLVTEESLSSGEYISDLILPTLSDFGSNINVNLEGDYSLLVTVFRRFTKMFPETELVNAVDIETRLDKLGDDMIKLGFSESDINIQINKEKFRLKELLKSGESIETYYYRSDRSSKQEDLSDTLKQADKVQNTETITQDKPQETVAKTQEEAKDDQTRSLIKTVESKQQADMGMKKAMTDRRLEEKEQVTEDKKDDKKDDKKEEKKDDKKDEARVLATNAMNVTYDHNGIGFANKEKNVVAEHHDSQYNAITNAKEERAKSEIDMKNQWRRLNEVKKRHLDLKEKKERWLQISDSRASAANDLELLLETRLAWLADWMETQWEEGHWTRFEFSNKWIGRGKERNDKFKTQIINILRCMIDNQMNQKKVSPTGNRTRNYYRKQKNIAGGWVGVCRCPDGQRVWVGDRHNSCGSIACFGGKSEFCRRGKFNHGSGYAMSCATGGQRAPVFWKKRFNQFNEKKCIEIDWSDPDPASSLEDVTTTDMSNGNAGAVNRRRANFAIFNYLWKNIKYPVASKDFPKLVVKPIEKLRNYVANGDLEMNVFSNPLYNRYFKFGGKHVNYARANTINVGRVLASENEDAKQTRVLEGIST